MYGQHIAMTWLMVGRRMSQATRLTLVQVLINSKGYAMNPMQSLYYVSPACFLCLLVPFGTAPHVLFCSYL